MRHKSHPLIFVLYCHVIVVLVWDVLSVKVTRIII